jgi:hypothetical protein
VQAAIGNVNQTPTHLAAAPAPTKNAAPIATRNTR